MQNISKDRIWTASWFIICGFYFNPGGIFATQAENFKVRDYIPRPPQYKIMIYKGRYPLNDISLLRLTLRRFIQPERVRQDIKDVLRLDYVALPDR